MKATNREAMRAQTKAREQGGVRYPGPRGGCWAEVRIYVGQKFPSFVPCSKPARKGKRTCHWHDDRELAAQHQGEPE